MPSKICEFVYVHFPASLNSVLLAAKPKAAEIDPDFGHSTPIALRIFDSVGLTFELTIIG